MKLNDATVVPAFQKLAQSWDMTLLERVAETGRAYVFKVRGQRGTAALKLYKRFGASGEGAGVHFLRNLAPDIGVQIQRSSVLRSAVLMEWLNGEPLDALVAGGDEASAVAHLSHAARSIKETTFRFPFMYRRVAPGLVRDLKICLSDDHAAQDKQLLQQSIALLDHLIATTRKEAVIHGDLGFSNVILTPNGPRIIDPKGFRADPAFELAKALIGPYDRCDMTEYRDRIARRGPAFAAALDTSPQRIGQWAAVILAHKSFFAARKRPDEAFLRPYLQELLRISNGLMQSRAV